MATAAGIALVAVAIVLAVHLIESVWVPLCITGIVAGSIVAVVVFFRNRTRGW